MPITDPRPELVEQALRGELLSGAFGPPPAATVVDRIAECAGQIAAEHYGTPPSASHSAWDALFRSARELLATHRLPGPEAMLNIGPAFEKLDACVALVAGHGDDFPPEPCRMTPAEDAVASLFAAADALQRVPVVLLPPAPLLSFGPPSVSPENLRTAARQIQARATDAASAIGADWPPVVDAEIVDDEPAPWKHRGARVWPEEVDAATSELLAAARQVLQLGGPATGRLEGAIERLEELRQ